MKPSGLGLLATVAGLAWATPVLAQCSKDTDCKGDRVCSAGQCVSPNEPGSAPPPANLPPNATESAPPPAQPPQNYPPPQQGYPPPQQGYPPPQQGYPPPNYGPPPGGEYPPPRYGPYPRYAPPPPPPPRYVERRIFAARFGVLGGLGTSSQAGFGTDGNFVFGLTGGLGIYLGPDWGLMASGTWNLNYPAAFVTTGQVFFNTHYYYGALGFGFGDFEIPSGGGFGAADSGFAFDGIILYKVAPLLGVGVQLQTIQDPGVAGYFSAQAALQFIY